jgi:hypothetical protein
MLTDDEKMMQMDAYRGYRKYLSSLKMHEDKISKICCKIIRSVIIEDKIVFEIIDKGLHYQHLGNGIYFDNFGKSFDVPNEKKERKDGQIVTIYRNF